MTQNFARAPITLTIRDQTVLLAGARRIFFHFFHAILARYHHNYFNRTASHIDPTSYALLILSPSLCLSRSLSLSLGVSVSVARARSLFTFIVCWLVYYTHVPSTRDRSRSGRLLFATHRNSHSNFNKYKCN